MDFFRKKVPIGKKIDSDMKTTPTEKNKNTFSLFPRKCLPFGGV